MKEGYDALVIGGGPAGATTALLLARGGWSVVLLERKTFPRRKVCGEYLSATNLPLLDRLGIGNVFRATAGPPVRHVGLFAGSIVLVADLPRPGGVSAGWGQALSRENLDTALLAEAARAGVDVRQPWSVVHLDGNDAGYRCRAEEAGQGSHELHARVVVAAHGSWEPGSLPTQAARQTPEPSDLFAFKAHFARSQLPAGLMPLLVFPGGYGGMVHCDGGRVSLSCCVRRDRLEALRLRAPGTAAEAVLDHIQSSCLGARQALADAIREGPWLATGPIRPGMRVRAKRGIFLVGNSAGEAHPVVAEGITMALQGAWLLADRLLAWRREGGRKAALHAVGQDYAARWRHCFAPRLYAASVLAHWAMRPAAVAGVLPLLRCFPTLLTWGARLSGKATLVVPKTRPVAASPFSRCAADADRAFCVSPTRLYNNLAKPPTKHSPPRKFFLMSFAILGLGTAVPPTVIDQSDALNIARSCCCRTAEHTTWLPAIYGNTDIHERRLVLGADVIRDVLNDTRTSQSPFLPTGSLDDHGPTTAERLRHYVAGAGPLALTAARQALERADLAPGKITHLITISCTGFHAPGVDIELMHGLRLPSGTLRTHLGFMGCHGTLNGLRVARAFTGADPDARVLLCAVELCSLHYHYGWDPQKMIANAIFADGAAAAVGVGSVDEKTRAGSWCLTGSGSCVFPGSADAMTWTVGDHGFEMTLSKKVPGLIAAHLPPWLSTWLGEQGVAVSEVASWAIHPGGPRILDAVEEAMNLPRGSTTTSREVFAHYGNMSSPTVLFILERLAQRREPRPCVALGFGPGLTVEAALFS